jgi:hypothetical protein
LKPYGREIRKKQLLERIVKDSNGCWIWQGGKYAGGYGAFSLDGFKDYAHRSSYRLYYGEIPEGKIICHRCDVKMCVNPDHLYAGTGSDNMFDKQRSTVTGRFLRASAVHLSGYSGDD